MLFPIDHGNSAMKTVNFVFPSGLIDNPIRYRDAGIRW